MKSLLPLTLLGLAGQSTAFPAMAMEYAAKMGGNPLSSHSEKRQAETFDAKAQYIDVTGSHAFVPPGSNDQRGPCPGLNALANHNYLPHNGVATIQQFVDATSTVFGMGTDLGAFLSIYGAVMDGNLASWSIGGPTSALSSISLLSQPQGISYSHNKYETDGSPTRGDLYQAGNAHKLQLSQFNDLYSRQSGVADDKANYDLSVLTQFRADRVAAQKASNGYYFSAPFAGVAVQPAAYTFIYRFMANHSAEYPEGRLDRETLKSLFAITGSEGSFTYTPGAERLPTNWYRRSLAAPYSLGYYRNDLLAAALQHPEFLEIGGNTGTPNSFVGVDPSDLTGGVFNAATLAQGNNLVCFAFQAAVQFAPDLLQGLVSDLTGALNTLNSAAGNLLGPLSCPQLSKVSTTPLQQFPGYTKLKSSGQY